MATLPSRLGDWELPHVHMWKDRGVPYRASAPTLVRTDTKIATIGSCFATELARGLGKMGLEGGQHPAGLFYNTRSIRQELERIAGGWPQRNDEPWWPVDAGWAHPFKDVTRHFAEASDIQAWSDELDTAADVLFRHADVVVVTLGLIEAWRNPSTQNVYRQIPHPQAFGRVEAEFFRLTQADMLDDLQAIRRCVREVLGAQLVLTVSPVPLVATMTPLDIQVANTESKSRIRSAVSEFVAQHDDVHYFHSYELVTTAEVSSDFMKEDGRHVHARAVQYILSDFLRVFADAELAPKSVDTSWMHTATKTASPTDMQDAQARPRPDESLRSDTMRLLRKAKRRLRSATRSLR